MGRKKLKGSAMLWAVFSLLIVVFVLTGILALNKSYAEEEVVIASGRRAEYYARSGIEVTASLIADEKLVPGKKVKDSILRYDRATVEYDWGSVVIERTGDDLLRLRSTARIGNASETVTGIMEYNLTTKKWEKKGYATD